MSHIILEPREECFSSVKEATNFLKKLGKDHGFNLRVTSSQKDRIYYCCDKAGIHVSESKGLRKANTKKTNCQFSAIIKRLPPTLKILRSTHNHEANKVFKQPHRQHKRLDQQAEEFVWKLKELNIYAHYQILCALQAARPGEFDTLNVKHIDNIVTKLALKHAEGLTATQTLLQQLNDEEVWNSFKIDDSGRLQYLAFAPDWGREMYRKHWRFITLDCTHDVGPLTLNPLCNP